jgi:hypothetical protein
MAQTFCAAAACAVAVRITLADAKAGDRKALVALSSVSGRSDAL